LWHDEEPKRGPAGDERLLDRPTAGNQLLVRTQELLILETRDLLPDLGAASRLIRRSIGRPRASLDERSLAPADEWALANPGPAFLALRGARNADVTVSKPRPR
jgi:hypothetical protein